MIFYFIMVPIYFFARLFSAKLVVGDYFLHAGQQDCTCYSRGNELYYERKGISKNFFLKKKRA